MITVRVNGKSGKFIRDFIFFGQGRLEYSLVVDGPMAEADQLVPFETAIAKILVKRAPTGNVA